MQVGRLVRRHIKAHETGDQDRVRAFPRPSHVRYQPGGGRPMNLKERIHDESHFFWAFSDTKATVEGVLVDCHKAACRVAMNCRHTGDHQGFRAPSSPVTMSYLEVLHLRDGKILSEWAEFDMTGILSQLK